MAAAKVEKITIQPENDDAELQLELKGLVDKITGKDVKNLSQSLEMLKYLIRTATSSMTSVPKPLKYLAPFYGLIKETYEKMTDGIAKKNLSDIVSILAMAGGEEARKKHDCLRYCLLGTMKDIGQWGHEYVRQLETEIIDQVNSCDSTENVLLPLIIMIVAFDCMHHAEIQACDLLMELGNVQLLGKFVNPQNYLKVCTYLDSCSKYVCTEEYLTLKKFIIVVYMKAGQYIRALFGAMQLRDFNMVDCIFGMVKDKVLLIQMAYICARQIFPVTYEDEYEDEVNDLLENSHLSTHFIQFARELDIMEPKSPEEVYKTWLEPTPPRLLIGEKLDSARQNLASSFVNAFVNAGFGCDKLLTVDGGNKWIYRNKEHAMISATASLGLLHLWDVDGGLTPIDKYLYSADDYIKSGALMALGIVNCKIGEECDPAFALLSDYVANPNQTIQVGAILGMGLAYVGSNRKDILDLLLPVIESSMTAEVLGITSLACGMVSLGVNKCDIASVLVNRLIELRNHEVLKSPYMRLVALGIGLCYYGMREHIVIVNTALEVLEEPFRTVAQMMLVMCSYAGSGDVLVIQELCNVVGEKLDGIVDQDGDKNTNTGVDADKVPGVKSVAGKTSIASKPPENKNSKAKKDKPAKDAKKRYHWDYSIGQAVATIGIAVVSKGEEIGEDMVLRLLGNIGRYSNSTIRKAVPLAIAYASVSNPQMHVIDVLSKYSHDSDDEVACNAIFGLGLVGAGTNNTRLAQGLRHLAAYHHKNPSQLFMVRISQGLLHLGKGTMTLSPLYADRQLLDAVAVAGLLTAIMSMLEPHALILGRSHYLLYSLVPAINPRWLMTLESETMCPVSVPVRVGQAVDTVGKAGTPKTIVGIHTHTTPILLSAGERAELATDEYEPYSHVLEGICILKKKEV